MLNEAGVERVKWFFIDLFAKYNMINGCDLTRHKPNIDFDVQPYRSIMVEQEGVLNVHSV